MKRLLALTIIVLMLFSTVIPVSADISEAYTASVPECDGRGVASVPQSNKQPAELPDGVYEYVVGQIRKCTQRIDVSDYKLTFDDMYALMMDITNSEPELFHLLNDWTYNKDRTNRYITILQPTYSMGLEEYNEALAYVRERAEADLALVDRSWSDLEKAMFLHDYLIAWFEYDDELIIHDIYTFLKEGKGVCEGYQLYYMYLLNQLGVPNDYIVSSSMGHVWNRVCIDGAWYNVDLTWDEPTNNHMAEIDHNYFLVSDKAMTDHSGGVSDIACTDTKYDGYSWCDVASSIAPLNGKWYAIMEHYICEYDPETGDHKEVYDLTERWPTGQDGYVWLKYLSGLSAYKGNLIFITPRSYMAFNPVTSEAKTIGTYDGIGFLFDGVVDPRTGTYYVTVGLSKNLNGVTIEYQINDADLPAAEEWIVQKSEEATCINSGVTYYVSSKDPSATKTEIIPAKGHDLSEEQLELTDENGKVSAYYQECKRCGKRCNLKPVVPDDFAGRFVDVKANDWYTGSVAFAVERGLFGGMSATEFKPNTDMSRAMLVTVLWRLEGEPAADAVAPFTDVKDGMWYTQAVAWAYENDIVAGVGGGKFAPDKTITREQLATILFRYAEGKGYDVDLSAGIENFPDTDEVSGYAVDSFSWARTSGIVDGMSKGDGKVYLSPTDYATRAQVATMLTRFIAFVCE